MSEFGMAAWRRALLSQRLDELAGIKLPAFGSTGAIYYGTPPCVRELLTNALASLRVGNLDRCEKLCLASECALLGKRADFEATLAVREVQPLGNETVS